MKINEALDYYKVPYNPKDYLPPKLEIGDSLTAPQGTWVRLERGCHELVSPYLTVRVNLQQDFLNTTIFCFQYMDSENNITELKFVYNHRHQLANVQFLSESVPHRTGDLPAELHFRNGKLEKLYYYIQGKRHRENGYACKRYDENGKLIGCTSYLNNDCTSQSFLHSKMTICPSGEVHLDVPLFDEEGHHLLYKFITLGNYANGYRESYHYYYNTKLMPNDHLNFFKRTPLYLPLVRGYENGVKR